MGANKGRGRKYQAGALLAYAFAGFKSVDIWHELIEFQVTCLKNGLNGVGIPDLIIAQNAKQHCCEIYSLDHHFFLMEEILGL